MKTTDREHQRRPDIIGVGKPLLIDTLATLDLRAVRPCLLERMLHVLECCLVDQRADKHVVARQRIADPNRCVDLLQLRHERVMDAVMDEQTPQRGAALASGADGGEGDGP